MTPTTTEPRLLAGKILVVSGIVLFALWTYYFIQLVRPIDIWDFSPLPVALAVVLIGVKVTRLYDLMLARAAVSYKRDLALGLIIGTLTELSLWAFLYFAVNDPESAERYIPLERLEEPGVRVGLAIYRYAYSHVGNPWSRYVGTVCAFLVLIGIWSLVAFTLLRILWLFRRAKSE